MPQKRIVRALEMLELHALSFMRATIRLSEMRSIVQTSPVPPTDVVIPTTISMVQPLLEEFAVEATKVGAKLAWVSADRLFTSLGQNPCSVTWAALGSGLSDIESRFADHLRFVKLFVIPEERIQLFGGADQLLNTETAALYPSVWFDCEEAAKCLCLGRPTASVFHAMRMFEIAIAAISARLGIPDPSKADRSWGNMLRAIKVRLDELHPPKSRNSGSEGAKLEEVYVSLDAVKNPWRNATMHVDEVYTEQEASHILSCASHLFDKMAAIFDESGVDASMSELRLGPGPETDGIKNQDR